MDRVYEMTDEEVPHEDPLLDLIDEAQRCYINADFKRAASVINATWVGTYEAVHVAHDMNPLTALILLEKVEDYPTIYHPEDWWVKSFTDSLKAIASLCRESLDRL